MKCGGVSGVKHGFGGVVVGDCEKIKREELLHGFELWTKTLVNVHSLPSQFYLCMLVLMRLVGSRARVGCLLPVEYEGISSSKAVRSIFDEVIVDSYQGVITLS